MEWISDFMKQLYKYYYLKKNGIEKKQKIYLLQSDTFLPFKTAKEMFSLKNKFTSCYNIS